MPMIAKPSNKLGKILTSEARDFCFPGLEARSCRGVDAGSVGNGGGSSTASSDAMGGGGFSPMTSCGSGGGISM